MNPLLLLLLAHFHSPLIILVEADKALTILHTNDVHARFLPFDSSRVQCPDDRLAKEPEKCYGGVARRHTAMKKFKDEAEAKGDAVLKLDAGDQFQGTIWFVAKKYIPIYGYMNIIKYDAMTFGNHEFDDGPEMLPDFLSNLTDDTAIVSANIVDKDSPIKDMYNKSVTFGDKMKNGMKIGVVGCTTKDTPEIASPGPQLEFSDEAQAVQEEVNRLSLAGFQTIVLLSHAGFDVDKRMCADVPGVDIIVGGHTHTFLYPPTGAPNVPEPAPGDRNVSEDVYPVVIKNKLSGKTCLVVQDFAYGKYLGHLRVVFDDAGDVKSWEGYPVLLDNKFEQDQKMVDFLEPFKKELEHFEKTIVTASHKRTTAVKLDSMNSVCRQRECALANIVADASVYFYIKKFWDEKELNKSSGGDGWTKTAICMINGGGVRDFDLAPGKNMTLGGVYTILPFGSTLDKIVLNGSTILEALEHSISDYDPKNTGKWAGKFMQVSGIKVVYDVSKPKQQRVVSVLIRCAECPEPGYEPLDLEKWYDVVTTSYISNQGGDGYKMIRDNKRDSDNINIVDVEVLMDYLIKYAPVNTGVEQRIRFVTDPTGEITRPPAGIAASPRSIKSLLMWTGILAGALRLRS